MTYDEEVREALVSGPEWDAETLVDAIPDGTLKVDGKFVRVKGQWCDNDGYHHDPINEYEADFYVIVPEDASA